MTAAAADTACTTICPEVFALNDDGYAEVIVDEVPDGLADNAREPPVPARRTRSPDIGLVDLAPAG